MPALHSGRSRCSQRPTSLPPSGPHLPQPEAAAAKIPRRQREIKNHASGRVPYRGASVKPLLSGPVRHAGEPRHRLRCKNLNYVSIFDSKKRVTVFKKMTLSCCLITFSNYKIPKLVSDEIYIYNYAYILCRLTITHYAHLLHICTYMCVCVCELSHV